jgi:hypothetical protein
MGLSAVILSEARDLLITSGITRRSLASLRMTTGVSIDDQNIV